MPLHLEGGSEEVVFYRERFQGQVHPFRKFKSEESILLAEMGEVVEDLLLEVGVLDQLLLRRVGDVVLLSPLLYVLHVWNYYAHQIVLKTISIDEVLGSKRR